MVLVNGATTVSGYGWNLPIFLKDMPTRQDLDKVCSDIPIYFADEEGLVAYLCVHAPQKQYNYEEKDIDTQFLFLAYLSDHRNGKLREANH